MKVFLDTNVILDILMESRPDHMDSATILKLVSSGAVAAVISTQSVIDASYVFSQRNKMPAERFRKAVVLIMNAVEVVSISENNIKAALRRGGSDLEDAAQMECACDSACDAVISSDRGLTPPGGMTLYTPKSFCAMIFGL